MSLSQFAHNHHQQRTGAMYSTYADSASTLYPYYGAPAASTSPVQDEYSAGEASYMSDSQRTHWQSHPTSSSYSASDYAPSSSSHSMSSYPSVYNTSSQQQALAESYLPSPSSSSRTYATSAPSQTSAASTPTLPSLGRASWAVNTPPASALYIVEPEPEEPPASGPAYAQVKTEEEDYEGGFIFELASDAPPTLPLLDSMPEVPLRATQACKAMRKLMGAFRLDPFAMHNGVKSAASQSVPVGIEVGPLREPPVTFEWQLDLVYPLVPQDARWSPGVQGLHAFEDDEEKWAPAMDVYSDVFDDEDTLQAASDAAFQTVMTPAQAVSWEVGYSEPQSVMSTSSSPSGYPVQPLSGMFRGPSQASSSRPSISRSLPSLPQPQTAALGYRSTQAQSYAISSPVSTVPSPPLAQSVYNQRGASSSAQELYYRQQQQQQHSVVSAPTPSSSMRISMLTSSSSSMAGTAPMPMRRQLEYPQAQPAAAQVNYASPSPPVFSSTAGTQRYRGGATAAAEEPMGWYRRSAFALEPYSASACT